MIASAPTPRPKPACSLAIFDTHPIQYRAPVFRALSRRDAGVEIVFFNKNFDGNRWWFHERGKIPPQPWELDFTRGFSHRVLHTASMPFHSWAQSLSHTLDALNPRAVAIYGYYLPEHWWLRRLCRRRRIPLLFIGETFGPHTGGVRQWIRPFLQKHFFKGVAQFVAIGIKTEAHYRSLGVTPQQITRAKYCVDTSFFALPSGQAATLRETWRRRLCLSEQDFVLLFVGRLFERKRPEDALAIWQALEGYPTCHLVMVGNGPLEPALRQKAAGKDRVHWLGFQNQTQVREAYHGSDLLLVPSEYETWGLVVNEAMACGKCALVTETCGVAHDLVLPGETGSVYPPGDVRAAAHWVEQCVKDPAFAHQLGEKARQKVLQEYSAEQFAEALLTAMQRASSTPA